MQVRNLRHALLAPVTLEQQCRQEAVVALRKVLNRHVRPQNGRHYEEEGVPAFRAAHGRRPRTAEEIETALFASERYRLWSAANRAAQEMIWLAVGEPLHLDLERSETAARNFATAADRRGALHLDPAFEPPAEIVGSDIHLQPGGYGLDRHGGDILAGALYESGGNVFAFGQGTGRKDSKVKIVLALLDKAYPQLGPPRRILDLGCAAGAATAAYAAEFAQAQVHGVDVGAAMLRYAHGRAEALGVAVQFHQMDAGALRFADNSFDLVVSHNLLHEIGTASRQRMLAECFRVLRPGGVCVHQDIALRDTEHDSFARVERMWDLRFNGEIHWQAFLAADLAEDMGVAGFSAVAESVIPAVDGPNRWYVLSASKQG